MDCLDKVVGLSRTTCDCWDTGKPIDFNESLSGLYVSDIIPLEFNQGAADCEKGGVWDILATSKENGIATFLADLAANYMLYNEPAIPSEKTWAGSRKFNTSQALLTAGNWIGLRLTPKQIKGGRIILRGIELALDNLTLPAAIDVYVYSSKDLSTPIDSVTVNLLTNNAFYTADFATGIELVISDNIDGYTDSDPYLEYYIIFQPPAGARYVNNLVLEAGGACCGRQKQPTSLRQYPWLNYTELYGIENTDISTLASPRVADTLAKGLRLKADYQCDTLAWLCDVDYDPKIGTKYVQIGRIIAGCLQNVIARNVCDMILSSNNINAVTVWSIEKVMGMRNHFNKNYMESSIWLAANYPKDSMDCLKCKETILTTTIKI
jgi:hypothetical protein